MPTSEIIIKIKLNNLYKAYLKLNKGYYCKIIYYLISDQHKLLESESQSRSVVFNSLQPHGLYSPWNSPGQNTGVGSLSLLQGVFPTQGLNPGLPHCRQIVYQLSQNLLEFSIKVWQSSRTLWELHTILKKKSPSLKHWQPNENSLLRSQESSNSSHLCWDVLWVVYMECAECTSPKFFSGTFLPTNLRTAGLQTFYQGRR